MELACCLLRLDSDVCDVGAVGSSAAPQYEPIYFLLGALDDGLDAAGGEVADPATEAELAGYASGVGAEADALHPSPDVEVGADHRSSSTP